jgi:hypothetical protein
MKPQFLNRIIPSFVQFVDHKILIEGDAYVNVSGNLGLSQDPFYPTKNIYASPYRQFVYDSSITGATIPSGFNNNGVFVPKNQTDVFVDYDNGRIIVDPSVSVSNPTCAYAYKDFNIYYAEARDEKIIFDATYPVRPDGYDNGANASPLPFDSIPYPAIFIRTQYSENTPYAFGGTDKFSVDFRCILLADSAYLLDAGLSILSDCARVSFPILFASDLPFNIYGDFKNGSYNYEQLCSQYFNSGELMATTSSVRVSKFSSSVNQTIGANICGGFADFTINCLRNPRVDS